ncbi:TPA: fimbrial protein [Citrobacter freundii]|nr:fimbrial-like protein [Citrobacter freundii]MDK5878571.1 fimbrial-like protein [Citrobacter freundii]HCR3765863.1 fimbrial protein [Citrobacter freundii]
MQQSPFTLCQPGLVLLIGLAGGLLPGVSQASSGINANLTANIINSTCEISLQNDGEIYLPTVKRSWFYNSDNSDRLTPTHNEPGTPFSIMVNSCSENNNSVKQLKFTFTPKSGFSDNQYQVFKNNATAGAAENVGVVVFSKDLKTNVLNADGSSNLLLDAQSTWPGEYSFSARYQNTGVVSAGLVTSQATVNVTYE